MTPTHWHRWHDSYDDPGSSLSRRLLRVQARVRQALDDAPPGPVRLLSMCAGQGRDVLPVLSAHPRRDDVVALLVELDARNAALAAAGAATAGLDGVTVRQGDASSSSAWADVVPAHVALVCGVFGNIPDADIESTVRFLPALLAPGGHVIWTRHRRDPDLTPAIRGWFADAGFEETGFDTEPGYLYGVGAHRLTAAARPYVPGVTLFHFSGSGSDAAF